MKHDNAKGTLKVSGIDLAKQSFHLHGVGKCWYYKAHVSSNITARISGLKLRHKAVNKILMF